MPENIKRLIGILLSTGAVAAIGWVDYVTGPEIGMSLAYLLPVAVSAWYGGVGTAIVVACFAGASWLAADLVWRPSDAALAIPLWNAFTRLVIFVSEGVFIAILHRDREKLRVLAARESLLARTDSTTGLPNARAFVEYADREITKGRPLSVLYIDLDNFKQFNDRLGHAAGDDILEEVARILRDSIEDDDLAARIGGDEFAILLCCDVDQNKARRTGDAIAARIRTLGNAYGDLRFGATVGVVFFRELPDNAEELLRKADDAMYEGKALGKGCVVVQNA